MKTNNIVASVFLTVAVVAVLSIEDPYSTGVSMTMPMMMAGVSLLIAGVSHKWFEILDLLDDAWHNFTKPANPQRTKMGRR